MKENERRLRNEEALNGSKSKDNPPAEPSESGLFAEERTDCQAAETQAPEPWMRAVSAISLLLVSLVLALAVRAMLKGERLPYIGPGGPLPCPPPQEGYYPYCHDPEHK